MDRVGVWLQFLMGKVPSWRYLAAAAAVAVVFGSLGSLPGWVGWLSGATDALLSDLYVLDPINVARVYYHQASGCEARWADMSMTVDCSGFDKLNQDYGGKLFNPFMMIFHLVWCLFTTVIWVWDNTGVGGRILGLLTMGVSALWFLTHTVPGEERDWDNMPFELAWVAILIPAGAAVLGLGLQWFLIALVFVFGKALAFILFLLSFFAVPLAYARMAFGVVKDAKELEELAKLPQGGSGPPKDKG